MAMSDQVASPWLKSETQRKRIWELKRIPKLNLFNMQYIFNDNLIVEINKMATERNARSWSELTDDKEILNEILFLSSS